MPNFNGDVVFIDSSGQVRSQSGDLTLRADATNLRDVIIGSGLRLRPDRDLYIGLGGEDLRWLYTRTGHLYAESGVLGVDPLVGTPYLTWGETGFVVVGSVGQTFFFSDIDVVLSQSDLSLITGSNLSVDGTTTLQDTEIQQTLTTRNVIPIFNDSFFVGVEGFKYKGMFASSGVFNALAPPTSGTFISVEDGDILPVVNARRALGSLSQRWARVHAASGVFNAISAPTSGTFIESAASIVPNRHNVYSLGTTQMRWANIFATSGIIANLSSTNFSATTVNATTVNAQDGNFDTVGINVAINFNSDVTITQNGRVDWDTQGSNLSFLNAGTINLGGTVDFNGGDATNITSLDANTAGFNNLSAGIGTFTSTATSTTFARRPTTNGSGMAMQDENYFEAYGGRALELGGAVTYAPYIVDSSTVPIVGGDDHIMTACNVRLRNYAVNTQHANGSQPSGWVIRMRLNETTHDWASGYVYFANGAGNNGRFVGSWSGNQTVPSGSRMNLFIDANGGAGVNVVFSKVWLGLTVSGAIA